MLEHSNNIATVHKLLIKTFHPGFSFTKLSDISLQITIYNETHNGWPIIVQHNSFTFSSINTQDTDLLVEKEINYIYINIGKSNRDKLYT